LTGNLTKVIIVEQDSFKECIYGFDRENVGIGKSKLERVWLVSEGVDIERG
jgi:hypothetical protein